MESGERNKYCILQHRKIPEWNYFEKIKTVAAQNKNVYSSADERPAPGTNYYRIAATGRDGRTQYSSIVKVTNSGPKGEVKILSNTEKSVTVRIMFINKKEGLYKVRILDNSGRLITAKTITVSGASSLNEIDMPAGTAAGIYHVEITNANNERIRLEKLF